MYKVPKGPGSIHGWTTQEDYRRPDTGEIAGARLVFWAVLVTVVLAVLTVRSADAAPTVDPFAGYTHVSDIFTGFPLFPPPPGCEQTTDWAGVGLTLAWGRSEFDIAHGIKARDFWCGKPWREHSQSGTMLSYRYYPLRHRG